MAKRKERIQNPEPFVPDGTESVKSKKRSKAPKQHQKENKLIGSNISSKIMKEALIQQKEVQEEEEKENAKSSFHGIEEPPKVVEDEDDIDDFAGFSETQSQFGGYEVSELLIDAFSSFVLFCFVSFFPGAEYLFDLDVNSTFLAPLRNWAERLLLHAVLLTCRK